MERVVDAGALGHSGSSVEGNWWTPMEELFYME
jgi:hypothetical protein